MANGFLKIKGVVQHYAWGGYSFIPSLLGIRNPGKEPFAEYWLGAHPNHPSLLEDQTSLADHLKKNNLSSSGNHHAEKDTIPYLLKILDVRQMLSIQVHPGKKGALEGYDKEEKAGIPLNAPQRNYKDKNHKPELMVALGDFYLLHGFKAPDKMKSILHQVPELNFLNPFFENHNYKILYEEVMRLPQEKVDMILKPLAERLTNAYEAKKLNKNDENFWAARAIKDFTKNGHIDRGIFSIYLFNLLFLKSGEGIFQANGLPHAYLEGLNVEVMANSDNVLRAGLTEKNIDVEELLKHVAFEPTIPRILKPAQSGHTTYTPPVKEFELHHYYSVGPISILFGAGEIAFVLQGSVKARANGEDLVWDRGEARFFEKETLVSLEPDQTMSLYRVLIPGG